MAMQSLDSYDDAQAQIVRRRWNIDAVRLMLESWQSHSCLSLWSARPLHWKTTC